MQRSLVKFIEHLQGGGRYSFTKEELRAHYKASENSLDAACYRMAKKGQLISIKKGFYVTIPPEYRANKIIPSTWFIDDLMKFMNYPYYVACLSAAALHGSAHQKPQVFHVISNRAIPEINVASLRIVFFLKKTMPSSITTKIKTPTGHILVSSPATTAIDLMRFENRLGGLNRMAQVIDELAETLDSKSLLATSQIEEKLTYVQRLGYILDYLGHTSLTLDLWKWLQSKQLRVTPLNPRKDIKGKPRDSKWNIIKNYSLEVEV